MQNYLQTHLSQDIMQLFPGLNREKYRLFINVLGHLSGSEVNLILEGEFGLLPIEIKHTQNVKLRDIRGI